jgi:death on curing protein
VHAVAAVYLFHLVKGHAFVDGNKRVAAMAPILFLGKNGWRVTMDSASLTEVTFKAESNLIGKPGIADLFRRHSVPVT